MADRAPQALHLFALEPVAETLADPNAYGFRPKRSTADAIGQCFIVLAKKHSPTWILEGDIKACFDRISHSLFVTNHMKVRNGDDFEIREGTSVTIKWMDNTTETFRGPLNKIIAREITPLDARAFFPGGLRKFEGNIHEQFRAFGAHHHEIGQFASHDPSQIAD